MKTSTFNKSILQTALFILLMVAAAAVNAQTSNGDQSSKNPVINTPVSFTAVANNYKVELKFSTEIESNLSHIVVERSIDGINFSDAALVFTYGNTSAKSDYVFPDNISKLKAGTVYYRLKVVNGDGTTQYSDVRMVKVTSVAIG